MIISSLDGEMHQNPLQRTFLPMMATDPNCRNAALMLNERRRLELGQGGRIRRGANTIRRGFAFESDTTNTISGRRSTC